MSGREDLIDVVFYSQGRSRARYFKPDQKIPSHRYHRSTLIRIQAISSNLHLYIKFERTNTIDQWKKKRFKNQPIIKPKEDYPPCELGTVVKICKKIDWYRILFNYMFILRHVNKKPRIGGVPHRIITHQN
jgi:hypothetical protein